jgi:Family of unknown function (DUF6390)
VTAVSETPLPGRELFASYAFPPNELGYCGPPDSSVLLNDHGPAAIDRHAKGFDGAWPYLEEIAAASGRDDPLDPEVVRAYWVGGPLLERVDGHRMLDRLRTALPGQPTGLLDAVDGHSEVLAHHSFHVFAVYPWVRFLDGDPGHPLRILQACRIRWGVVDFVDDDHVVISSPPVRYDDGLLVLGEPVPERVRWRRDDGVSLAPRPAPGATVAAHWDWVCDTLDEPGCAALATATVSTLNLVNRVRR